MSNIVKFPKRLARPAPEQIEAASADEMPPHRSTLAKVGRILRTPLFLVLYWLRLPVLMVCRVVSVPLLFAFLAGLYFFPDHRHMAWAAAGVSFAAFVMQWLYDWLLMRLSPEGLFFVD